MGRQRGYSGSHAALLAGVTLGTITRTPRPPQGLHSQPPPVPPLPNNVQLQATDQIEVISPIQEPVSPTTPYRPLRSSSRPATANGYGVSTSRPLPKAPSHPQLRQYQQQQQQQQGGVQQNYSINPYQPHSSPFNATSTNTFYSPDSDGEPPSIFDSPLERPSPFSPYSPPFEPHQYQQQQTQQYRPSLPPEPQTTLHAIPPEHQTTLHAVPPTMVRSQSLHPEPMMEDLPSVPPLFSGRAPPMRAPRPMRSDQTGEGRMERAQSAPQPPLPIGSPMGMMLNTGTGAGMGRVVSASVAAMAFAEAGEKARGRKKANGSPKMRGRGDDFLEFSETEGELETGLDEFAAGRGQAQGEERRGANLRRSGKTIVVRPPRLPSSYSDPASSPHSIPLPIPPSDPSDSVGDEEDGSDGMEAEDRARMLKRQKKLQALLGEVPTELPTTPKTPTAPTPANSNPALNANGAGGDGMTLSAEEKARLVKRNKKLQALLGDLPSDLSAVSLSAGARPSMSYERPEPISSSLNNPLPPLPPLPPSQKTFRKLRRPSDADQLPRPPSQSSSLSSGSASRPLTAGSTFGGGNNRSPPQSAGVGMERSRTGHARTSSEFSTSNFSSDRGTIFGRRKVARELGLGGRNSASEQAKRFEERERERQGREEVEVIHIRNSFGEGMDVAPKEKEKKIKKVKSYADLAKNEGDLYRMLS
ncbi:hypothetical protein BT69DRAFT_621270 [Atractiella rhizophila]|nr:hypothetical protein BT69DRAFT_621270 [Atractiella rhizophila]